MIRYFSTDVRFPGDGQGVVTVVALVRAHVIRTYSQLRSSVGEFCLSRKSFVVISPTCFFIGMSKSATAIRKKFCVLNSLPQYTLTRGKKPKVVDESKLIAKVVSKSEFRDAVDQMFHNPSLEDCSLLFSDKSKVAYGAFYHTGIHLRLSHHIRA